MTGYNDYTCCNCGNKKRLIRKGARIQYACQVCESITSWEKQKV